MPARQQAKQSRKLESMEEESNLHKSILFQMQLRSNAVTQSKPSKFAFTTEKRESAAVNQCVPAESNQMRTHRCPIFQKFRGM